jgi:hypothetical protein
MSAACADAESKAIDAIAAKTVPNFMTIPRTAVVKNVLTLPHRLFFGVAFLQQSGTDFPRRRQSTSRRSRDSVIRSSGGGA